MLAGRDGDEVVVFRESMLATWKAPDKWTAGLGWGAEHLERTVAEVVEETVLETREERGEPTIVIENKELAKALKREQKQSSRWVRKRMRIKQKTFDNLIGLKLCLRMH